MTSPSFLPNAKHGEQLAAKMHGKLVVSLQHLAERIAASTSETNLGDEIAEKLLHGKQPLAPSLYLLYQDIVRAALDNDVATAQILLSEILKGEWTVDGIEIRDFSADAMGRGNYARYKNCLNEDPSTPMSLTSPDAETSASNRRNILDALELMKKGAPDHAAEILPVLSEIVLAKNIDPEQDAFGGASSFSAWGAIFLCSDNERDQFDLFSTLVHETAHLILFAEAADEPLVLNDPQKKYKSPLRSDLRPMDGIFHAAFVSARMHHANSCLQNSDISGVNKLPGNLQKNQENLKRHFEEGFTLMKEEAELTPLGKILLYQAAEYIL